MKSTVKQNEKDINKPIFPRLVISRYNDSIWLITTPDAGTCVAVGNSLVKIGTHYDKHLSRDYSDFHGIVTLEN